MINKDLKKRLIEISYKYKLSHLGSVLTAVDIIDEIYQVKKEDERFVLSSGHAALALYVVNEKYLHIDAEKAFEHHGVHPDRCNECKIDCSSGSLGHGLGIALGMALSDRTKNVYCLVSDGETAEGSITEALRVTNELGLTNLKIHLNYNGYTAYRETPYMPFDPHDARLIKMHDTNTKDFPFLKGLDAHYYVMRDEDYKVAMEILA